jgi:hypothetical protein
MVTPTTPASLTTFKAMRVKIVLREKESGRYFRDHAQWVTNAYEALTFQNILEAEEFCRVHQLKGMQFIQQSGYFHRPLRYSPAKAVNDSVAVPTP